MGTVALIGGTAPFWHIWADRGSTDEFMDFPNLRRFLSAFGTYFAFFCSSSFFFWIKNFIDPQYIKIIRIINVLGGTFLSISIYFLLWVFIPYSDFPSYVYDIVFAIAAVFIAYGIYLLNRFIADLALHKNANTRNLISFIFRVRNTHYKRVAVKAMYAQEYKEPLRSEDTVEENTNAFEDDFYETLEKVEPH